MEFTQMEILQKYLEDAKKNKVSFFEASEQYFNDYPMGEPLKGSEYDLAASLIKNEDFITTQKGHKVGFVKGKIYSYFIYYKTIPHERQLGINKDFLIYECDSLLGLINIQSFARKIFLYLKNHDDSIPMEDLEKLVCNYLILVHGSVENFYKEEEEVYKILEEQKRAKKKAGAKIKKSLMLRKFNNITT